MFPEPSLEEAMGETDSRLPVQSLIESLKRVHGELHADLVERIATLQVLIEQHEQTIIILRRRVTELQEQQRNGVSDGRQGQS